MTAPNPFALTAAEAAARIGVSYVTLERWRSKGTGPRFTKLGDNPQSPVRYPAADLELWLAARTH